MIKKIKITEYGRSMVEMLAVLAIIGVLSMVGLMGYKRAMLQNQVNGLLNEITKRLPVIAAQRIVNNAPSLNEFEPNTVGDTELFVEDAGNKQFAIFADPVKAEVCEKIAENSGLPVHSISSAGRDVTGRSSVCKDGEMKFVFNDDLTLDPRSEAPTCTTNDHCGGCQSCQNGRCQDLSSKCTSGTCTNGVCVCSDGRGACNTTCCAANEVCVISGSSKVCRQQDLTCTTNAQCNNASKFCNVQYATTNPTEASEATCDSKGTLTKQFRWNDRTFYIGSKTMSWTAAANFCQAHGKVLAPESSFGLYGAHPNCARGNDYSSQAVCDLYDVLVAEVGSKQSYWLGTSFGNQYAYKINVPGDLITTNGIGSKLYPICE